MISKENVLSFVKLKGPILPREAVKEFGGDTFILGAVLSQLVDSKEIKISHSKIGGSPVYYTMGQEQRLQELYSYLPAMEKRAFDMLKNQKIHLTILQFLEFILVMQIFINVLKEPTELNHLKEESMKSLLRFNG